jgi:hypothetical protein
VLDLLGFVPSTSRKENGGAQIFSLPYLKIEIWGPSARFEAALGAKARVILSGFLGTTEVEPGYKAVVPERICCSE